MIRTGSDHISFMAHIFVMYDSHLCHVWVMYVPYMKKKVHFFIYESGHILTHFMFKSSHDISRMNRTLIFVCDSYMIVQYGYANMKSIIVRNLALTNKLEQLEQVQCNQSNLLFALELYAFEAVERVRRVAGRVGRVEQVVGRDALIELAELGEIF